VHYSSVRYGMDKVEDKVRIIDKICIGKDRIGSTVFYDFSITM